MTPSTSTPEHLIRVFDEHWIKYVAPACMYGFFMVVGLSLLVSSAFIGGGDVWVAHVALLSGAILILFAHHWFFFVLLSEVTDCIIITNKRLIRLEVRLLLRDSMVDIAFDKMKTVEATKVGLLQNILNYGSLHFEGTKASIIHIPHPNSVARDIEQAMGMR